MTVFMDLDFKTQIFCIFLYLVCIEVSPLTHRELLSAHIRTPEVATTSCWITQSGAHFCIQAAAQQESASV